MVRKWVWYLLIVVSLALVIGSIARWVLLGLPEVFGFITGAVCVLLVIEQNIWNFPVGLANNVFFIVLFISARLYGDMTLQFVYIVLGVIGWYQWLYGGMQRTSLHVTRTPMQEAVALAGIGVVATVGMTYYLAGINDAAPFLDALTTVLSLLAQYLLNRKRVENWWIWITADVLYVWLYIQKDLYLTAVLYAIFIGMCVAGLTAWLKSLREQAGEAKTPLPEGDAYEAI